MVSALFFQIQTQTLTHSWINNRREMEFVQHALNAASIFLLVHFVHILQLYILAIHVYRRGFVSGENTLKLKPGTLIDSTLIVWFERSQRCSGFLRALLRRTRARCFLAFSPQHAASAAKVSTAKGDTPYFNNLGESKFFIFD